MNVGTVANNHPCIRLDLLRLKGIKSIKIMENPSFPRREDVCVGSTMLVLLLTGTAAYATMRNVFRAWCPETLGDGSDLNSLKANRESGFLGKTCDAATRQSPSIVARAEVVHR